MTRLFVCVLMMTLASCNNVLPPAPKTAGQAAFEVTATYAGALAIVVAYDKLPTCTKPVTAPLCATQVNRHAAAVAVNKADPVVRSMTVIARATNPDATALANAVSAATAAVGELSAFATTLKVK